MPAALLIAVAQVAAEGVALAAGCRLQHLPAFRFGHFRYAITDAVAAASVAAAEANYPVLLFLEGVTGFRQMNAFQVEELVSRGYIVAALDQPGTAAALVFPGGRRVTGQPVAQLRPLIQASSAPGAGGPPTPGRAGADSGLVAYLARDVGFVLDQLAALNRADPAGRLTGRLDLARTGVFDVSLGGIMAAEACRQDPHLRACLVLDALMPTATSWAGLRPPTMWLTRGAATMRREWARTGGWPETEIRAQHTTMRAVYRRLPGAGYIVQLRGAFHGNFTDLRVWLPLAGRLGLEGPLGPGAPYPKVLFKSRRP